MTRTKANISRKPSIVGDVIAEEVRLNNKGGSVSAILKRSIRGSLTPTTASYGAKIEFKPGVSCTLVAGEGKIRVVKIENGFVLTLDEGKKEVVDGTTKAVLKLYEEMLKAGKVTLVPPVEAEKRLSGMLERIKKLGPDAETKRKEPPSPK